jgi:hypothetical protein
LKESIEQKGDQALVPHGYNPSYSEGWDQGQSERIVHKNPISKIARANGLEVWLSH